MTDEPETPAAVPEVPRSVDGRVGPGNTLGAATQFKAGPDPRRHLRGPYRKKPFGAALSKMIEEATGKGGRQKLFDIIETLIQKAHEGDVRAITEIADRLDGKAVAHHANDEENPLIPPPAMTDEQLDERIAAYLAARKNGTSDPSE